MQDKTIIQGTQCLILRTTGRTGCVIQIEETGAVLEIELETPLDISRACLICAIHPVPARIELGQLKGQVFKGCRLLHVEWPSQQSFAPPARFQRRKRQAVSAPAAEDTSQVGSGSDALL